MGRGWCVGTPLSAPAAAADKGAVTTARRPFLRPLPRAVTRPLSMAVLVAWGLCMALLVQRSYLQASAANLATDLARYGTAAQWRGVYYRGEKVGFTVSQVVPVDDGFELQEDGRLQMSLLGATTPAVLKTTARVDREFALRSFDFSLDPGTGPMTIRGRLDGVRLTLTIGSGSSARTETRELREPPALMANLPRRLASEGLTPGARHTVVVFDPATMTNAPVAVLVSGRDVVMTGGRPMPAFKVQFAYSGLSTTAWITDTGEVVREESPLGLMSVRETQQQATQLAVSSRVQSDMLAAAAVVPVMRTRIDEPRDVIHLSLRLDGVDLSPLALDGVGQRLAGNVLEVTDPREARPGPRDPEAASFLAAEPLIESDDPEIVGAARRLTAGATGARDKAERLVREVNGLLDKKPTLSLPSAREVLRTKVGDCNEHTALYVALARAAGLPARIAVGLALVRGAFYYHAWPEVYIDEDGRGYWLPVDPTFNQFPADVTHVRLLRGGLDRQAAVLPLIGRLEITVLDVTFSPDAGPREVVGREPVAAGGPPAAAVVLPDAAVPAAAPRRGGCWWFTRCGGRP